MSLSFVASAVQTATSDGGFEETKIESKQVEAINQRNANKPLFEQLRQNQEEEQANQEELQREMMRGTRALDEEDVAHLDALERQRQAREQEIQERTHQELAAFRAARAERQQTLIGEYDEEEGNDIVNSNDKPQEPLSLPKNETPSTSTVGNPLVPKLVVKKRKRRDATPASAKNPREESTTSRKNTKETKEPDTPTKPAESSEKLDVQPAGLGSLLSGYGSSSDEED